MITWQGGDPRVVDDVTRLPSSTSRRTKSSRRGRATSRRLMPLLVGRAAVALGAGRDKKSDPVDLSAGVLLTKKPGDAVTAGEPVMELRYNDESRLAAAVQLAAEAIVDRRAGAGRSAAGDGMGSRCRRGAVR